MKSTNRNMVLFRASSNGAYMDAWVTGMYNVWYCKEKDMENLVMINPVSTSLQVLISQQP